MSAMPWHREDRMTPHDHPDFPARSRRWNVMVTAVGVTGCTGSFRCRWMARLRARSNRRYFPGAQTVTIEWKP
jgi:hypothetical protein